MARKNIVFNLIRMLVLLVLYLGMSLPTFACTTCNRPLQAAIFDAGFLKLFFYMLLPFALVWAVVAALSKLK